MHRQNSAPRFAAACVALLLGSLALPPAASGATQVMEEGELLIRCEMSVLLLVGMDCPLVEGTNSDRLSLKYAEATRSGGRLTISWNATTEDAHALVVRVSGCIPEKDRCLAAYSEGASPRVIEVPPEYAAHVYVELDVPPTTIPPVRIVQNQPVHYVWESL